MKKLRRIWKIMRVTSVDKIWLGFLFFILVMAFVFQLCEPSIETYGDGIWYAFNVVTTIGFGDYYAVTLLGRILTMILGMYGILVVALIPGVIVSYYMEFVQMKKEETTAMFLEKLEHLDELSRAELVDIAQQIRHNRYH